MHDRAADARTGLLVADSTHVAAWRRGPWHGLAHVEMATAEYVDWFNTRRLHTAIGGVPAAEYETAAYYTQPQPRSEAGPNN